MSIIQRRVFFGKAGVADQLASHILEGERELEQRGVALKSRILTDYMSGRTDRVVVEWEVDDLREIEGALERAIDDSQAQAYFSTWMEKLNQLIHYAEVENWMVR